MKEDKFAEVSWCVDDIRENDELCELFPENVSDITLKAALRKCERQLRDDMTERGWDSLKTQLENMKDEGEI